jgi:hypothetical protein
VLQLLLILKPCREGFSVSDGATHTALKDADVESSEGFLIIGESIFKVCASRNADS